MHGFRFAVFFFFSSYKRNIDVLRSEKNIQKKTMGCHYIHIRERFSYSDNPIRCKLWIYACILWKWAISPREKIWSIFFKIAKCDNNALQNCSKTPHATKYWNIDVFIFLLKTKHTEQTYFALLVIDDIKKKRSHRVWEYNLLNYHFSNISAWGGKH